MSVSKVTPNDRYSASVNPPAGFAVSATTIALSVTATMRPVRASGLVQSLSAFTLSDIRSPTSGACAETENDARGPTMARRLVNQLRAAGAAFANAAASRWRRPTSNDSSRLTAPAIGARGDSNMLNELDRGAVTLIGFVSICVNALETVEL